MIDEDALLRAVIADPDDDAPRLIYADWLDEQGRGERAEFIRVQIALAEMPTNDERRPKLQRHLRRLIKRRAEEWAKPLRPFVWYYCFRRGFVEEVGCGTHRFLSRAADIFSLAPVRQLHLFTVGHYASQLGHCPHLSRPLALSLSWSNLNDRDVSHFANSPFFGRLTVLRLTHNRITGVGARHLARSPYLGSLDDLYLKGNTIPREGRAELRRRYGSRVHF